MSFRTANGTAKTSDSDYLAKTGTLNFGPSETVKTIIIRWTWNTPLHEKADDRPTIPTIY